MTIKPVKLLKINMTNKGKFADWIADDGTSDPYLNHTYQWTVDLSVDPQYHGSPYTRTPYQYDGFDILIGDWIVTSSDSMAVRVVSINTTTQTGSYVRCVVEDVDRYNIFIDPASSGVGIGNDGYGYIFQLGDDGIPLLSPVAPGTLATEFQINLTSRFHHRNLLRKYYRVNQANHSMSIEDMICLNSNSTYSKADASSVLTANIVGIVKEVYTYSSNHSLDWFAYEPVGDIILNINPSLPGNPGDIIYLAEGGGYTATKPIKVAKPIYIRLESGSKGIKLNRSLETTTTTIIVNTLTERNALNIAPGTQVHVKDIGSGHWGYYLYDGTSYTLISSQDTVADIELPSVFVVDNIAARDALTTVASGTQVYVKNIGNNKWGYYIYNGTGYILVSSQDSMSGNTELTEETITLTVTPTSISPALIGLIPETAQLTVVELTVNIPFNDVNSTLTIGNDVDHTVHMDNDLNDLSSIGTYEGTHGPQYTVSTNIKAYFNFGSSTTGEAVITISYS